MDVMVAIRTRKSVRAYLARPVEDEKLNVVLEAARLAPSASNRQEWRFVVVREIEIRKKLAAAAGGAGVCGRGARPDRCLCRDGWTRHEVWTALLSDRCGDRP